MKQFQVKKFAQVKIYALTLCLILIPLLLIGCKKEKEEITKLQDLEFTVVEEADLPDDLLTSINEKKATPFRMTYSNDNYLYIIRGYGEQKSGGYSIAVNDLFLGNNGIYFKTTLIGPGPDELVTQVVTHPYIVVKMEFMDKKVIFD